MRTILVRSALSLVAVVVLAGCAVTVAGRAGPDPAAGAIPVPAGGRYSDAGHRFRITPPPGWAADTSGAQGTAVVFRDPAPARAGAFTANLNVLVVPAAAALDATVVGARQELRRLPGYTPVTDEAAVLADGAPAHLLGGTFTDRRAGPALRNLQLFTVHGGSTVVATGTAPAAGWDSFARVFDAALRTLTVP